MKIERRKKSRKIILVLNDEEAGVLSALVDIGFDDFFKNRCRGNQRLKLSRIAADFFDKLLHYTNSD
ncbi:MAG: hypothetical protein A3I89_02555 [Candidatus Harrisonbacteria bacterium RIFCSPLOWO2_02_FULL_41_11]|uniref:Uncharacterized protein n=1 Tax=Candidatus Harrisonbacteria bacterium RIFCSPHIGHO2_02_FULL_42_16 TaxID=1798404 RepID=A0A1G1ZL47_9BACT|nr:MAG: hypothetical protein A3B92_00270 [Candidatus Harrisonbacteria bacterium RIFCSPHIGHO2_02_FULL_42_16]OGY66544.1 MAG: hypothetical protein A3I89_02555 [Candidatus Harrisonbacteria bacterium RIFCSPLOWO2_02_FULL_41_11]